jgi:hypothetical protein
MQSALERKFGRWVALPFERLKCARAAHAPLTRRHSGSQKGRSEKPDIPGVIKHARAKPKALEPQNNIFSVTPLRSAGIVRNAKVSLFKF